MQVHKIGRKGLRGCKFANVIAYTYCKLERYFSKPNNIYIYKVLCLQKKMTKEKELNIEWMLSGMHSGMGTCPGVVL